MRNVTTPRPLIRQHGFTLIELMISIAIVGILAALAIPAYAKLTVRAQVSEGMTLADAARNGVAEFYMNTGHWPTTNAEAGITAAAPKAKYVTQLVAPDGTIRVTFGGKANANIAGKILALQPHLSGVVGGVNDGTDDIFWTCGYETPPASSHQPVVGPASEAAATVTTIPLDYLPSTCRA